jgi:hypothetical protein
MAEATADFKKSMTAGDRLCMSSQARLRVVYDEKV